jgi:hypothetical protein
MRAAAAITSITMKGGTSLRSDGLSKRVAASSIVQFPSMLRGEPAPLSPHFHAQFRSQGSRNQT